MSRGHSCTSFITLARERSHCGQVRVTVKVIFLLVPPYYLPVFMQKVYPVAPLCGVLRRTLVPNKVLKRGSCGGGAGDEGYL